MAVSDLWNGKEERQNFRQFSTKLALSEPDEGGDVRDGRDHAEEQLQLATGGHLEVLCENKTKFANRDFWFEFLDHVI